MKGEKIGERQILFFRLFFVIYSVKKEHSLEQIAVNRNLKFAALKLGQIFYNRESKPVAVALPCRVATGKAFKKLFG